MMNFKFVIPILFFSLQSYAAGSADEAILEDYIQEGVKNNLALKQKRFQYEQAVSALDEAKRLFLPSISVEARYSQAGGGREIEFPVGDLMNPVYSTLNQLLVAHGDPSTPFPQIPNEVIPFLREKEHETKIRTVLPLLQPALFYNYSIKNALADVNEAAMESYKNTLVAEIKNAYYKYLQTNQLVKLFNETTTLLDENIRVSEVLFDNQMVTKDVVYRAQAEKLDVAQQLSDARKKNTLALSYFNFLLNRPLQTSIRISDSVFRNQNPALTTEKAEQMALQNRQEIVQLRHAISAAQGNYNLAKSQFYPGLSLVVDYGYQGEKYSFTEKDDYWMASLVLSWNLFNGFQDQAKKEQASLAKQQLQARHHELQNQIRMQVKDALLTLKVSREILQSAAEQEKYASESFKIIARKYEQGMANHLEYLDARVTMTNAKINKIIKQYDFMIGVAEFEKTVNSAVHN